MHLDMLLPSCPAGVATPEKRLSPFIIIFFANSDNPTHTTITIGGVTSFIVYCLSWKLLAILEATVAAASFQTPLQTSECIAGTAKVYVAERSAQCLVS